MTQKTIKEALADLEYELQELKVVFNELRTTSDLRMKSLEALNERLQEQVKFMSRG